jgi:hypothetical protein
MRARVMGLLYSDCDVSIHKTTGSPYMYNTFLCQRAVCMGPMGVNDMHAVHVGAKIVHVYVQLYLLV